MIRAPLSPVVAAVTVPKQEHYLPDHLRICAHALGQDCHRLRLTRARTYWLLDGIGADAHTHTHRTIVTTRPMVMHYIRARHLIGAVFVCWLVRAIIVLQPNRSAFSV